jgi:hypothetical protein
VISRLAGVLLGKPNLDSLYGQQGELPRTVPQLGDPDSARARGLRRRRMNKIGALVS